MPAERTPSQSAPLRRKQDLVKRAPTACHISPFPHSCRYRDSTGLAGHPKHRPSNQRSSRRGAGLLDEVSFLPEFKRCSAVQAASDWRYHQHCMSHKQSQHRPTRVQLHTVQLIDGPAGRSDRLFSSRAAHSTKLVALRHVHDEFLCAATEPDTVHVTLHDNAGGTEGGVEAFCVKKRLRSLGHDLRDHGCLHDPHGGSRQRPVSDCC